MPEALLQEIREAARATVRARALAAEELAIDQELANQQHRELMAATAVSVTEGQERARRRRVALHAAAVGDARIARDRRDVLATQRQKIGQRIGALRADLHEIEKRRERLPSPPPEDYPTLDEIAAHRSTVDELTREIHRLHAQVQTSSAELARAVDAEDEAQSIFDRAAAEELRLRGDL